MTHQKLEIVHTPPFYRVHYRTLERYLARVYHLTSFNVLKVAQVVHGLYPEYLVQGVIPPDLQTRARRIRTGDPCGDLSLILTVLCADGHIPAGLYVIDTQREPETLEVYKTLLQRALDPLNSECVHFKEKHRDNLHFSRRARIIDRSLIEWLKQRPEAP